jgi:hypothetical protein
VKPKRIPAEALLDLRRRLGTLSARSPERRRLMQQTAALYGISEGTLYRALRERAQPKALQRADYGVPRILPKGELERYGEIIAALKLRTGNQQGRHLSTVQAIRLLEDYGVETPGGLLQVPTSGLTKTTVNRYLRQWGYDHETLTRPPPAVRFQARHSHSAGTSTGGRPISSM